MMMDSEGGLSYNARETLTGSDVSSVDAGRSMQWRDGDDDSTTGASQSQDSLLLAESNILPTTNVVGVDGSVTIVEHPQSKNTPHDGPSSSTYNSPSALMLEVPTEMHPIAYERNAAIPEFTWQRKLSDTYKPLKEFKVNIFEGIRLMGLGFRMYRYVNRERGAGRPPIIDPFTTSKAEPTMGVPIGGIGAGTIGRGWRGEFNKWQLFPGVVSKRVVDADQFSAYIEVEPHSVPSSPPSRLSKLKNSTATVLSPNSKPSSNLQSWGWKLKGDKTTYHALYPRAWTAYEEHPTVRMECRQITPVFPHNYKETSYPVGVFVWKITNTGKTNAHVSVMFTFQNGTGSDNDLSGGHVNRVFETNRYNEKVTGVTLSYKRVQEIRKPPKQKGEKEEKEEQNLNISTTIQNPDPEDANATDSFVSANPENPSDHANSTTNTNTFTRTTKKVKPIATKVSSNYVTKSYADPCTFAIAAKRSPGVQVSYVARWQTNNKASATALWNDFSANGVLPDSSDEQPSKPNQSIGAAVAAKVTLAPGETKEVVFSLAWDIPILRFNSGSAYYRRYTRFYGTQGDSAIDIATDALHAYPMWEKMISGWQAPILSDPGLPDFYKQALFNELYFIADGGSIWTNENVSGKKLFSAERYGELMKDD
jgi:uncharacterized protein (DUF608 family)